MSESAMERCWATPELITAIAEGCLEPFEAIPYVNRPGLSTIATLARTCRIAFHGCLPVLWNVQYGPEDLVKCLPPDTWTLVPRLETVPQMNDRGDWAVKLLRDPEPHEWDRYDLYAHHVKIMVIIDTILHAYLSTVKLYEDLTRLGRSHALLPSLRGFTWRFTTIDLPSDHLLAFLSSSVTLFDVELLKPRDNIDNVLVNLPLSAPRLQTIQIFSLQAMVPPSLVAQILPYFQDLRSFSSALFENYVPGAILDAAASLPSLECLGVHATGFYVSGSFVAENHLVFPSLRTLYLNSMHSGSTNWTRFLASYRFPVMEELRIECDGLHKSVIDLPRILHSKLSPAVVESIVIRNEGRPDPSGDDIVSITYENLQPFQAFTNLVRLELSVLYPISWDDSTFIDFIRPFPRLQTLVVAHKSSSILVPLSLERPTIVVLAEVVRSCPGLQRLSVTIDATIVPSADEADRSDLHVNNQITRLGLYNSPIGIDLDEVAKYLHAIFPSLVDISVLADDYETRWATVVEKIREL